MSKLKEESPQIKQIRKDVSDNFDIEDCELNSDKQANYDTNA